MLSMGEKLFRYRPIAGEEDYAPEESEAQARKTFPPCLNQSSVTIRNTLVLLSVSLLFGILGFFLGRLPMRTADLASLSLHTVEKSFMYNRTFAEAPSDETDAAWESIFPPHGGFFHHPKIAPQGASLAVYHQLHCLDGIRHSYWALYDAATQGKNISLDALPKYSTPWHTRHCIDFLRQMLICHADTTIEHNDPRLHGIVGFSVKHQCVQWEQVRQWIVHMQADEQKS